MVGFNVEELKKVFDEHPERKELRHLEKAEREILFHMLKHQDFFAPNQLLLFS